ncbi:MAG: N-glycosylase/DNA lyase [Candidatus Diapherotrites archaeon]|nr:N-glycosylase/DNA lyase [Candidatus Diapherotrites archaeon]
MKATVSKLLRDYEPKKFEIKERLFEFKQKWHEPDENVFAELAFCLCTPQSKAKTCDAAVRELVDGKKLFKANAKSIGKVLTKRVRFHNNKARYITEARKKLMPNIKQILLDRNVYADPVETREWLVSNVRGLGLKEASHFLRNIGFFEDIAILDRHILKNLAELRVIKNFSKQPSKKQYLEIEKKMREFSEKIGVPMHELDLFFWSQETGEIFK